MNVRVTSNYIALKFQRLNEKFTRTETVDKLKVTASYSYPLMAAETGEKSSAIPLHLFRWRI